MSTFRSQMRAACVQLLTDYKAEVGIRLQIYPGRPRSINPPTAFVDRFTEGLTYLGPTLVQRVPRPEIVVIHGLFDSKEAVDQADAFADGFFDWVNARFHAASGNSIVGLVSIEDDPNYVPDWVLPENQHTYYATVLTLEGLGQ